jgi:hypothetical protein
VRFLLSPAPTWLTLSVVPEAASLLIQ